MGGGSISDGGRGSGSGSGSGRGGGSSCCGGLVVVATEAAGSSPNAPRRLGWEGAPGFEAQMPEAAVAVVHEHGDGGVRTASA